MIPSIKDCVKGEVIFQYYKNKELWYKTENGFLFPVPIEDTQDPTKYMKEALQYEIEHDG